MIRKMLAIPHTSDETIDMFSIHCAQQVKQALQHHGVERWDAFYHRLVFQWAGHVRHMSQHDPIRCNVCLGANEQPWFLLLFCNLCIDTIGECNIFVVFFCDLCLGTQRP